MSRIQTMGEAQVKKLDLAIMRSSSAVFLSEEGKAAQASTAPMKRSYGPDVASPTVGRTSAAHAQSPVSNTRTAT